MEIPDAELEVQLPGSDDWQAIKDGESFNVPANAIFNSLVDYCCSYFD